MKGIRDITKKSSLEIDEANKKVEYFCGICQQKINMNFPTIECTTCSKWIHKRCVSPTPWEKAVKNKHVFKCKNCKGKDEAPKVANDPNIKDVEKLTDAVCCRGRVPGVSAETFPMRT